MTPSTGSRRNCWRAWLRRRLLAAVLTGGLIFPAAAVALSSRTLPAAPPWRSAAWSNPSSLSASSFSPSSGAGASYPASCTASAPGVFPDPQCQTADDLHRLVTYIVPALAITDLLLVAVLVVLVVPGRR